MLTSILTSPAALLVVIIIIGIMLALILAKLTTKPSSDNGLVYNWQDRRNYRKH